MPGLNHLLSEFVILVVDVSYIRCKQKVRTAVSKTVHLYEFQLCLLHVCVKVFNFSW